MVTWLFDLVFGTPAKCLPRPGKPQKSPRSNPSNHPHRRLGALAALSTEWPRIATPAQRPSLARLRRFADRLGDLTHPFWSSHYTLRSRATESEVSLVGRTRVHEILANYYIPSWYRTDPGASWQAYCNLPAGTASDPVKRAIIRLFGQRRDRRCFHRRLWQHQALLQIYRDFCLEDSSDCEDCPFPEQLGEW